MKYTREYVKDWGSQKGTPVKALAKAMGRAVAIAEYVVERAGAREAVAV